jgi:predicted component of type VI protein secretion system
VKTHGMGVEMLVQNLDDFNGVKVARRLDVMNKGSLGMRINITELGPAGPVDPRIFVLKGHDWKRQFTPGMR